jgi:hypothetical protein
MAGEGTGGAGTAWPHTYAKALERAAGGDLDLSDEQVEIVLDLAREVAHGTERRWAPVSTYLAGMFVARRSAEGVPVDGALREAAAVAAELLAGDHSHPLEPPG